VIRKVAKISLLAGGDDYYPLGLCSGLVSNGVRVNYIGGEAFKEADILKNENVCFYNLRGSQNPNSPKVEKAFRVLRYYLRLIKYAWKRDTTLFHIQWLNKFIYFDRTILNLYYKLLGKKLVFTAHNVNEGLRDGTDNFLNRQSLKLMYRIVDHIIVHTDKMRRQVIEQFDVNENKVSVIPFGINSMVFKSSLTRAEARKRLGLADNERVALFFGRITPYKGLDDLLLALTEMKKRQQFIKLIIAGSIEKNSEKYWQSVQRIIKDNGLKDWVFEKTEIVPDRDVEVYFKAADVLVLPYKYIFQSGVLFLAFNFGLPVIATDVGSLREYIIDGKIGFICRSGDPLDLAEKIGLYFRSNVYRNLEQNRLNITNYAMEKYSWDKVGEKTHSLYESLF